MDEKVIQELQNKIVRQLDPLINRDCILTDLPYHQNIGDIAIWQGEIDFIKRIDRNLINQTSAETFSFPILSKDVTILLSGGGNFGDLYRGSQEFRLNIIQAYPENRIIVLPQSVWYKNFSLIEEDAKIMANHKDLIVCARDLPSFEFMKKHFSENKVLLVPDMAFCIHSKSFFNKTKPSKDVLMFIRTDKELDSTTLPLNSEYDVHDWPTFEKIYWSRLPSALFRRLKKWCPFSKKLMNRAIDFWYMNILRHIYLKDGLSLLSDYRTIVTTRLHAMILGFRLGKEIRYIDNTTKKLSSYADCWLKDVSSVRPLKNG